MTDLENMSFCHGENKNEVSLSYSLENNVFVLAQTCYLAYMCP